jgi:hypothetical protein
VHAVAESEKKSALKRWFGRGEPEGADFAALDADPAAAPTPTPPPFPAMREPPPAEASAAPPPPPPSSAHVRRTGDIPVHADTKVPLRIRFLDAVQGIKVGKEFRFEVVQEDRGAEQRVAIDRLDFSFAPLAWGEVRPGPGPTTGVVRVIAVHKPVDIYDRPKYDMVATFKAHGGTVVETVTQFALGLGLPVVELAFYIKHGDEEFESFRPMEQRKTLDPRRDFEITPVGAAEVFADGKRLYLRLLRPEARPRVTVRFPNEETATLEVDLRRAGAGPLFLAPEEDPEPLLAPPPPVRISPAPAFEMLARPEPTPRPLPAVREEAPAAPEEEPPPRPPIEAPPPGRADRSARFAAAEAPDAPPAPIPPIPPRPALDPSAGLRAELSRLRLEVERARAAGAFAQEGPRLAKRAEFLKGAVQSYVGPDVERLREVLTAVLRETGL